MDEKIEFSLPEKKQKSPIAAKISIVMLILLLVLAAANLLIRPGSEKILQRQTLSAEQTKQLASKLAARNLYSPAASAWQDYVSQADLSDEETARIYFQIAALLEKADKNAEAIEYYYRSEMTAKLDDLVDFALRY